MEKALNREAVDFEREVEKGFHLDVRQTFAKYAKYVLHTVISIVLGETENDMIVSYNAAKKAAVPKRNASKPKYSQPDDISVILEALEEELK